jgi:hypothetical protein
MEMRDVFGRPKLDIDTYLAFMNYKAELFQVFLTFFLKIVLQEADNSQR